MNTGCWTPKFHLLSLINFDCNNRRYPYTKYVQEKSAPRGHFTKSRNTNFTYKIIVEDMVLMKNKINFHFQEFLRITRIIGYNR